MIAEEVDRSGLHKAKVDEWLIDCYSSDYVNTTEEVQICLVNSSSLNKAMKSVQSFQISISHHKRARQKHWITIGEGVVLN